MKTSILITTLTGLTAASLLVPRAGGPAAKPIPAICTVINPLPHATCGTANVNGYMPNPDIKPLYQSYFGATGLSVEAQAKQCKQQCYGYGNVSDCKSSFVAYKVPTPKGWLGTPGGDLETACLLYSENLDPNDFVEAPTGQYVKATGAGIYCPK